MLAFIKLFFVGLLISFLGQIPLGNMNMVATTISVEEGHKSAWKFGLGAAIIEIIYLRIALTGMDWVSTHQVLFTVLSWITIALFLVLGILAIVSANKLQEKENKISVKVNKKVSHFLLGVTLSAINPIQIPFWFTWSISLLKTGVLQPSNANYNFFTIGAGIGTLAGISIYIHGGRWVINKMGTKNKTLRYIMGIVFIIAALVQLYKLVF